jgi:hypothetical protein
MRNSTLWMLAASAAVAVACVAGGAAAQDAPAKPAAQAVTADTLNDVEVMRVVLMREGLAPGTPSNPHNEYNVAWTAASGVSSSEAFVVAGDGATFVLRTSDPVAPSAAEPKTGEATPEPSAWDQAEAELAGRPRMVRTRVTFDRYDAAKVEALRGRILEQLAKYGHKVRGLGPDGHLTVVVVGARRSANFVAVTPGSTSRPDESSRSRAMLRGRLCWLSARTTRRRAEPPRPS